jgi:hypothetical protein
MNSIIFIRLLLSIHLKLKRFLKTIINLIYKDYKYYKYLFVSKLLYFSTIIGNIQIVTYNLIFQNKNDLKKFYLNANTLSEKLSIRNISKKMEKKLTRARKL